jgi:hypothetical protein
LGRPLYETNAKRPCLLDKFARPLESLTAEERNEYVRNGKIGLFQRFADIGGAQKSPPGY